MASTPANLFDGYTIDSPNRQGAYNFFVELETIPYWRLEYFPGQAILGNALSTSDAQFHAPSTTFQTFRVVPEGSMEAIRRGEQPDGELDKPPFFLFHVSTALENAVVVLEAAYNLTADDGKIFMSRIVHDAVVAANKGNEHETWSVAHIAVTSIVNRGTLSVMRELDGVDLRKGQSRGVDDKINVVLYTQLGRPVERLRTMEHQAWAGNDVVRIRTSASTSVWQWVIFSLGKV